MYQNVFFEKEKSIIHCWDDEKVTLHLNALVDGTLRDGMETQSVHGERLKKLNF